MTSAKSAAEYVFGRFRLQPAVRRLLRDGEAVTCPRRVFDLLLYLIEQRERAVGRDELVSAVWGRVDVTDMQLGQIVLRARRAVDDDGTAQQAIATVAGFGYHWVARTLAVAAVAVEAVDAAEDSGESPAADEVPRRVGPGARLSMVAAVAAMLVAAATWRSIAQRVERAQAAPVERAAPLFSAQASAALVLPLTASDRTEQAWVRLGGMDLIAERLRAGGIAVPTSESVLAVLRAAGDDPDARLAALREAFGDVAVIQADAGIDASGQWVFSLRAHAADDAPRVASASRGDPIAAAREAADTMAAVLGGEPPSDPSGAVDLDGDWSRARAALLANETDAARRILAGSRHFAAKPQELAVRLAQIDVFEGRLDVAVAATDRVLADVAPGDDDALRARALYVRGSARERLGDFAASWRDFDAALAALPPGGDANLHARALAGRGASAVAAHRFDDALADMGLARSLYAAAGDAAGSAHVDANIGMLELYRARPAAALAHLDAAAERLHKLGAQHARQVVATAQIDAHLALLQPAQAAEVAERAWALRERSMDAEQRVDIGLNRAQVLMYAGRYRDAAALLADPENDTVQSQVKRARTATLRAELAWRQGRWQDAATLASTALAAWPAQGGERAREPVALIQQRALLALGRIDAVRELALRLPAAGALPADAVFRELGRAEWRVALRDIDGALAAYRAALAAAENGGIPASIAEVAASAVPVMIAHGRLDEARALAGRVAPWAAHDFDSALVQLRVLRAGSAPAAEALEQVRALAGEREIPEALTAGLSR